MDPDFVKKIQDKITGLRQHSEQLVAQMNANSGAISGFQTMLADLEADELKAKKSAEQALADAKKNVAADAKKKEDAARIATARGKQQLKADKKAAAARAAKLPKGAIPPGVPVAVFPENTVDIVHLPGKQTPKTKRGK